MRTKNFGITKAVSVILALIAAFTAALSCISVNAKALDTESVRNGVVPVVFFLKNAYQCIVDPNTGNILEKQLIAEDYLYGHGSGFFVGKKGENPQYVVTNEHVVDSFIKANEGEQYLEPLQMTEEGYLYCILANSCEMRVYYDENNYDVAYVDCYGDMEKVDLAVLKLRNPTDKRTTLSIAPVSDDDVGDTVYTVGYPGNADNDFTNASKFGVNDSSVHKGSVVRIAMNDKGVERISTDATIQHGNSGGPLVNENGQVIGVNTNVESTVKYNTQVEADYYSISSKTLMEFLDKNSIPYEKATATKKGLNPVVIILIVVGAVVVIGGVAAVVIVNNKKKSAPAQANNSQAAPTAPQATPSQPANFAQAVVVCERGALAGRTFAIGSGVLIGRNPQKCGMCFPVDTKGVSGVHCEIRPSKNGGFEIIDRGSSNGTTLGNGQRLSPNVPVYIASGTYVSLGSTEQMIQVRY